MELFAAFAPRMRDETTQAILAANPYVNISALDSILYPYQPVNIIVGLRSHGETPLDAEARLSYIRTNNDRIFRLVGANEWSLEYENTSALKVSVEGSWRITAQDIATAMIAAQSNTVISSGNSAPYVPAFEANAGYSHIFSFPLTLEVNAEIVGSRSATLDGSQTLPAIALLNARAEYKLFGNLSLTGDLRNILNQTYVAWNGYPAMKIFASLGITAAL
jgi:outer membrane receptor protein involved in Fe transport